MSYRGGFKMAKYLSINRKKVKASKSVNGLVKEYFRDEKNADKSDDGHRLIDVAKTKDNVILYHFRSNNLDQARRKSIKIVNQKRSERPDDFVRRADYSSEKSYKSALNSARRKLRKDGVDVITSVVQPSADFINQFDRSQQIQFFQDCLDVMNSDRETYGRTLAAVVHFDENIPHMQVISSTISLQTLNFMTKKCLVTKLK